MSVYSYLVHGFLNVCINNMVAERVHPPRLHFLFSSSNSSNVIVEYSCIWYYNHYNYYKYYLVPLYLSRHPFFLPRFIKLMTGRGRDFVRWMATTTVWRAALTRHANNVMLFTIIWWKNSYSALSKQSTSSTIKWKTLRFDGSGWGVGSKLNYKRFHVEFGQITRNLENIFWRYFKKAGF